MQRDIKEIERVLDEYSNNDIVLKMIMNAPENIITIMKQIQNAQIIFLLYLQQLRFLLQ